MSVSGIISFRTRFAKVAHSMLYYTLTLMAYVFMTDADVGIILLIITICGATPGVMAWLANVTTVEGVKVRTVNLPVLQPVEKM